jgi:translation initiation factor IF-3
LDNKKVWINRQIRAREVRLIDKDGNQVGVVSLDDALRQAEEDGLDLVQIAPEAKPSVCKIMDYGKFLFEQSKKTKKKTKQIHIKELKLRPVTDIGDYNVKLKKAIDFLQAGDKVKFTVRFRGREMAYQNLGMEILKRLEHDLLEYGTVEVAPKIEMRQMTMMVGPKAAAKHK